MELLNSSDLDYMRSTQEQAMSAGETGTIKRPIKTANGKGGQTVTYTEIEVCKGRISIPRSSKGEVADIKRSFDTLIWTIPAATDIKTNDLIELRGVTYEVSSLGKTETYLTAIQATLELVK